MAIVLDSTNKPTTFKFHWFFGEVWKFHEKTRQIAMLRGYQWLIGNQFHWSLSRTFQMIHFNQDKVHQYFHYSFFIFNQVILTKNTFSAITWAIFDSKYKVWVLAQKLPTSDLLSTLITRSKNNKVKIFVS